MKQGFEKWHSLSGGMMTQAVLSPYAGNSFNWGGCDTVRIGVSDYHFQGYRTSILRYLLDHGDWRFVVDPKPEWERFFLNVAIGGFEESPGLQVLKGIGSAAVGGGAGNVASQVLLGQNVGMAALDLAAALNGTLPNPQNFVRPVYPSKAQRAWDHFKKERIGVKIGVGTDRQADRLAGEHRSLTLGDLAVLVNYYKG
jgi:hypothetical protein